jgi:hypothetical protein
MTDHPSHTADWRGSALFTVLMGLLGGYLAWTAVGLHGTASDFGHLWAAARFVRDGINPYDAIGPGRAFDFEFPMLYPLPAAVAMLPLAWLSMRWADVVFFGLSTGLLVWALTRQRTTLNPQLCVLGSFAYLSAAANVQWEPLLTAAALLPTLGFLFACKPTMGLALLTAYPSKRAFLLAATFGLLTVAIWPWWVPAWLMTIQGQAHIIAPVTLWHVGGPLVLLALTRWRRPEARLLVALACIPHTPVLYAAVPLFLIVRTWREGLTLAAFTYVVGYMQSPYLQGDASNSVWTMTRASWQMALVYLPGLLMVLRRPNVWMAHDPMQTMIQALTSFAARRTLRPVTQEG